MGVGGGEPPQQDGEPRGEDGPPDGPVPAGGPPARRRGELSVRQRALAGAFIGVLYAVGMSAHGKVLPGVVGGVLAGILLFLVLRETGERRRRRG